MQDVKKNAVFISLFVSILSVCSLKNVLALNSYISVIYIICMFNVNSYILPD